MPRYQDRAQVVCARCASRSAPEYVLQESRCGRLVHTSPRFDLTNSYYTTAPHSVNG